MMIFVFQNFPSEVRHQIRATCAVRKMTRSIIHMDDSDLSSSMTSARREMKKAICMATIMG